MITEEFQNQVFKTSNQWKKGGLFYRLVMEKDNRIIPYSMPAFSMIREIKGVKNPSGLAVDECEQIYLIDKDGETYKIYLYDPESQILERISWTAGCGSDPGMFKDPKKILIDKFTLWVLDTGNHRVQAFSRENYQIKYITDFNDPVDIGLDEQGHFYVIDKTENNTFKILTYDINGQNIKKYFDESCLKDPVGLAIGTGNELYVVDRTIKGFLKFTIEGCSELGDFSKIPGDDIPKDFRPSNITIDRKGNLFVIDDETGQIFQFDQDGSYIGKIPIPLVRDQIHGIAIDNKGSLYVCSSKGIAFFNTGKKFAKEKGIFYSRTLDSGITDCQWHRLELEANIPPEAVIEVYHYSSDDPALKRRIDNIFSDQNNSIQKKAEDIDKEIHWIGPEIYSYDEHASKGGVDNAPLRNMLFRGKRGRYLWLKIVFSTFDENVRPTATQMKVFYPRISYLRYLPAIYQEDPVSKDFLERFLSIFETAFYDLETEISHVFRYFDPDTSPQNFLIWLASWLNVALEEDWPEDKKRYFIKRASELYRLKGTLAGIEELIKIYTGKKPLILEHSKIVKPMVLNEKRDIKRGEFRLGINSILLQTPIRGFRLGDDSILGRVALRDMDILKSHGDPFLPLAYRFTVTLDMSSEEFTRYAKGVERILNDEKPAHTLYKLNVHKEMRAGMDMYVGINTRVTEYKPISLGNAVAIGSGIIVMGGEKGGRVERHSRLDKNMELI